MIKLKKNIYETFMLTLLYNLYHYNLWVMSYLLLFFILSFFLKKELQLELSFL